MNSKEQVKNIIENFTDEEKLEAINNAEDLGLSLNDITKITESIEDESIKEDIIRNHDKYGLNSLSILAIIRSITDDDFKMELVDDRDKYGLTRDEASKIVLSIENEEIKKKIVKDIDNSELSPFGPPELMNMIVAIDDDNFKEEIVDKFSHPADRTVIIQSMKDDNLKKDIIANRKHGLEPMNYSWIAQSIEDDSIKKEMIDDYSTYGFICDDVSNIATTMKDDSIKLDIINNAEKYALYNFLVKGIAETIHDEKAKNEVMDNIDKYAVSVEKAFSIIDAKKNEVENQKEKTEEAENKQENIEPDLPQDSKDENKQAMNGTDKPLVVEEYSLNSVPGGTYIPGLTDEELRERDRKREEAIQKNLLELVLARHPEYEEFKDELVIIQNGDASATDISKEKGKTEQSVGYTDSDLNGTYSVYRRPKEKELVEVREKLDSSPGDKYSLNAIPGSTYIPGLTDEELKERDRKREEALQKYLLDIALANHPEYEEFKDELVIEPNTDASDDGLTDGDQFGTFSIYRVRMVEKDLVPNTNTSNDEPKDENKDARDELIEARKELLAQQKQENEEYQRTIERLEAELEAAKKSKKFKKEKIRKLNSAMESARRVSDKLEEKIAENEEKLESLQASKKEDVDYASELAKGTDAPASLEARIQDLERQLVEVAAKYEALAKEQEDNAKEIEALSEESNTATQDEDIARVNTRIANLRGRNNDISREMKELKAQAESLKEQKESLDMERLANETLTPEEKEEIFKTLKNNDISRRILQEKGAYDIFAKLPEERTAEEQEKLESVFLEIIEEISKSKLENRDTSVLDLVQVIYNFDDMVIQETAPRTLDEDVKDEDIAIMKTKASQGPQKVNGGSKNASGEPAPEDMQGVLESNNGADIDVTDIVSDDDDDSASDDNAAEDEYDEEVVFEGVYPMDTLYGNFENEEEQQAALDKAMLDYAVLQDESLKDYDPSELVIKPGHQASDSGKIVDDKGNIVYEGESETQLTPFTIVRRTKKKDKTPDPVPTPEPIPDPVPDPTPTPEPTPDPDQTPEPVTDDKDEIEHKPALEFILAKIHNETNKDEDHHKKDIRTYMRSQAKLSDTFRSSLRTEGSLGYLIFSVIPASITVLGAGIDKLVAWVQLRFNKRPEKLVENFKEMWETLTPADLEVIWNEYKGKTLIQEVSMDDYDRLIAQKMTEYGMAKVEKINEALGRNYDLILQIEHELLRIDTELERTDLTEDERAELMARREELYVLGGSAAMRIEEDNIEAVNILNSGVHGLQEDFKAKQSRMNYMGYRWMKVKEKSNEEMAVYGQYGEDYQIAVARAKKFGDPEDYRAVLESFLNKQGILAKDTEITSSIFGDRSTGSSYFLAFHDQLDYRPDPYIRNAIMTITTLTAIAGAVNAVSTEIKNKKLAEQIEEANKHNAGAKKEIDRAADDQLAQQETIAKGNIAQSRMDSAGYHGISERHDLDIYAKDGKSWVDTLMSKEYAKHMDTHDVQEAIAQQTAQRTSDLVQRYTNGQISQAEFLKESMEIEKFTADAVSELARKYAPGLSDYVVSHPQFKLDGFLEDIKFISKGTGDIVDKNDAILQIMRDADYIKSIDIVGAPSEISSDMLTTMIGLAGIPFLYSQMRQGNYRRNNELREASDSIRDRLVDVNKRRSGEYDLEDMLEEDLGDKPLEEEDENTRGIFR